VLYPYTLKNKLILYFSTVFILVSLCISFYYSNYTKNLLEKNIIDNTQNNLNYILSNIDKQLQQCQDLSDWLYLNRNLDKLLIRNYSDSNYNFDYDISEAYREINGRITNSSIGKYVVSVIIEGKNKVDLKLYSESDFIDIGKMKATTWFKEGENSETFVCAGIEDNLAKEKVNKFFIPFVRKVIFSDSRKTIGWQVIGVSPDLIRNSIKDFEVPDDDLLLILDKKNKCIFSSKNKLIGQDLSGSITIPSQNNRSFY
jgi:two-component system sensor histidine kinase YesM